MVSALVLAGQREGAIDPLAEASGLKFKALAPVAGRPMALHVLGNLAANERVGEIIVSINEGSGLEALPEVAALIAAGRLRVVASRKNLVDSVLTALDGAAFPVLITTADNVLMSTGTIEEIDRRARAEKADVAVAMARREDVLSVHAHGQRKFYKCACGEYSNCNAYWIGSPKALGPAELFRSGGQFVKYPMRVVNAFGLAGLVEIVRFRFGLSRLDASFRRLSKRFGLTIRAVVVSDGAAAIDVDHERSRLVAEEVLLARRAPSAKAA
ncbi:NTP transferase domain-containing protein [Methylopila sp. M107]|uniref:nucleotidyltransferase family protein n=1 Tax=Methylopila sp. M107 TaxID=1101190 RepID=UPI00037AC954|nr:NTP transferase domain-containing protein [Methylopila sp. M107]